MKNYDTMTRDFSVINAGLSSVFTDRKAHCEVREGMCQERNEGNRSKRQYVLGATLNENLR
jgi:hypothetical protein